MDTKLRVLNVVTIVMEALGPRIAPVAPAILHAIPALWAEAQEQHLLKGVVLVTLTRLVQALGSQVARPVTASRSSPLSPRTAPLAALYAPRLHIVSGCRGCGPASRAGPGPRDPASRAGCGVRGGP